MSTMVLPSQALAQLSGWEHNMPIVEGVSPKAMVILNDEEVDGGWA